MKKGIFASLIMGISMLSGMGVAKADEGAHVMHWPSCIRDIAIEQNLPSDILIALIKTEGGHVGTERYNPPPKGRRYGSYDLGIMQVNDVTWLNKIAQMHFDGDMKLARDTVKNSRCYNVSLGAWIFKGYLVEAHGDFATAVGYYNSHTPIYMHRYQHTVANNLLEVRKVMKATGYSGQ